MATYKEEQGTPVLDKDSDTGAVVGEVFYDTVNKVFKIITNTGTETLNT